MTAYAQCIHYEFIAFTKNYWVTAFRKLHTHIVHAQKIANRHDPTCLDVINVCARIFEKMGASACLQMTPIQLNLHHVTRFALLFSKMTHQSCDLMNALLNE
jgi:hypothetical protein